MPEINTANQNWKTLAEQMGWNYRTLQRSCKLIKKKLDKIAGRSNYRTLTPAQVKVIITHLGWD